jgi:NCS1 family nucleobase:cation symporter-1
MAFFTGFGVSAIIYYVLNRIWPTPGAFQKFEEIDESEFAERQQEAMEKKQKESQEGSVDEKDKDAGSDDHDVEVRQV